ncbi:MAG TPA: LCP family protein [Bacillota bacterium]|nr:LCP family protein [Bacillota bacterium]
MSKRKKWAFYIISPLLIIVLSVGAYAGYLYIKTERAVNEAYVDSGREGDKSDLRDKKVDPIEDNVSVLIIGLDESERRKEKYKQELGRSDALMLATFNKQRNDVKLLSIPRDSRVYIPEVDYFTKVNHAHAFGGHEATIETVENFLNVPVDYYVTVDFEAFIEIIDSLGGIFFNVPYELKERDSKEKKNGIHLYPGLQKLNGEEALAVARTRKYDSDIHRGERQQEIIRATMKEMTTLSSVFKLDNFIEAIAKNMTTNLKFHEMKKFLSYGMERTIPISSVTLEGDHGRRSDGIIYFEVDEESRKEVETELRTHLNLPPIKDENIHADEDTDYTDNPLFYE